MEPACRKDKQKQKETPNRGDNGKAKQRSAQQELKQRQRAEVEPFMYRIDTISCFSAAQISGALHRNPALAAAAWVCGDCCFSDCGEQQSTQIQAVVTTVFHFEW
ncbi:Small vasohibin-binding protein [Acipenser ruthenus]|uniref:Small vasohibin-binding protein n=1 Tax=Acipenser ruthenus TaxID=7906 RepID=A0A444URG1_ACIRT|nr:Small vasohibin-binding protein [Acipenser ruthenus]